MYELDHVRFRELHYAPCKLAHRGIYLHDEAGHSEHVDPDFNRPRPRHEAWVGPPKSHQMWAGQETGRPWVELTPPSGMNAPMIDGANDSSTLPSGSSEPLASIEAPTEPVVTSFPNSCFPAQSSHSVAVSSLSLVEKRRRLK